MGVETGKKIVFLHCWVDERKKIFTKKKSTDLSTIIQIVVLEVCLFPIIYMDKRKWDYPKREVIFFNYDLAYHEEKTTTFLVSFFCFYWCVNYKRTLHQHKVLIIIWSLYITFSLNFFVFFHIKKKHQEGINLYVLSFF